MARPLRIEFPNALYHITSRGDRREDIYEDDENRKIFLHFVGKVVTDFNWLCHGYCLMSNHYHLIVETLDGNLAKGMRQLNGVYTQTSKRRHNRTGHLFQGRYKAIRKYSEPPFILSPHPDLLPKGEGDIERASEYLRLVMLF